MLDRTVKSFFAVSLLVIALLAITNLIVNQEATESGYWTLLLFSLGGSVVFWVLLWLDHHKATAAEAINTDAGTFALPQTQAFTLSSAPAIAQGIDTPAEPPVPQPDIEAPPAPAEPPVPQPDIEPPPAPAEPPVPQPDIEAPPAPAEPPVPQPDIEAPDSAESVTSVEETGLQPTAPPAESASAYLVPDHPPEAAQEEPLDTLHHHHLADKAVLSEGDAIIEAAEDGDHQAELQIGEAMAAPLSTTIAPEQDADNLMRVEGIGPKYNEALRQASITTYNELATAPREKLVRALQAAGYTRIPASIDTWAEQAGYLVRGDDAGLEVLQKALIAGRRAQ